MTPAVPLGMEYFLKKNGEESFGPVVAGHSGMDLAQCTNRSNRSKRQNTVSENSANNILTFDLQIICWLSGACAAVTRSVWRARSSIGLHLSMLLLTWSQVLPYILQNNIQLGKGSDSSTACCGTSIAGIACVAWACRFKTYSNTHYRRENLGQKSRETSHADPEWISARIDC